MEVYVGNHIRLAQMRQPRDPNFADPREGVRRLVNKDLTTLESIGAPAEIRRSVRNGIEPVELTDQINDYRARGFSNRRIESNFGRRNRIIDWYKSEYRVSDDAVRSDLLASENDVAVMISNRHLENKINEWNRNNKIEIGSQRFREWVDEADNFARDKIREFRYQR